MEVQELTVREAEIMLAKWGATYQSRDFMILTALASRVPKRRIAELTGIARSTIDRIQWKASDDLQD